MHLFSISSVLLVMANIHFSSQQENSAAQITSQLSKFSISIFQSLATKLGPSENLLISPFSVATVLAMAHAGAKGNTEIQLKNTLQLNKFPNEQIYSTIGNLVRSVKGSENFTLEAANRMYVDKSYQLAVPFQDILTKQFGAPAQSIDFKTASEDSRMVINKWVEDFTHLKIKNLLPRGSIDSLTNLVLVNALYFKGDWMTKFDTKLTIQQPFFLGSENSQVNVPMMNINGKYLVGNLDQLDARILRLPYKGGKLSMFIILPNKIDGLLDVEAKLLSISGAFATIEKNLVEKKLDVALPKFKIEATVPNLKELLIQLGIKDLFDKNLADLSGIPDTGRRELFVSDVFQKCFIEVNEEGSEAAAASGLVVSVMSASVPRPKEKPFVVNHPALFFIRSDASKLILFGGRLAMPSAA